MDADRDYSNSRSTENPRSNNGYGEPDQAERPWQHHSLPFILMTLERIGTLFQTQKLDDKWRISSNETSEPQYPTQTKINVQTRANSNYLK